MLRAAGAGRQLARHGVKPSARKARLQLPKHFTVAGNRNGGMQFMRSAGKQAQLIRGLHAAGWLAEQAVSQSQRLIGADDITAGIF